MSNQKQRPPILLIYKQSKVKGRKDLSSRWDFVGKKRLLPNFMDKWAFIGWIYYMFKGGIYRVQTRLPLKRGFTPLLHFEVRRVEDGDEKPKLHITISDDYWGALRKIL